MEYLNWKPNEPNNANDGEDCVFAYDYPWDYGTFTWNDGHCDRAFRYVCQVYKEGQGSEQEVLVKNSEFEMTFKCIHAKDFHAPTDPWLPDGTPNSAGCRAGWIKFGGGCFRYFGDTSQGSLDRPKWLE